MSQYSHHSRHTRNNVTYKKDSQSHRETENYNSTKNKKRTIENFQAVSLFFKTTFFTFLKNQDSKKRQRISSDHEEHYHPYIGEILHKRCFLFCFQKKKLIILFFKKKDQVLKKLGEGAFSLVVECKDLRNELKVALKIQRQKHKQAAEREIRILELIQKSELPNGQEK